MQAARVQLALCAALLLLSATSVDPGPIAFGGEARIDAVQTDAGDALRSSADASALPSAPAPRRVAVAEVRASIAPEPALKSRSMPRVDRRAPRRRIPRMTVDGAADH